MVSLGLLAWISNDGLCCETHIGSKSRVGDPCSGGSRGGLLKHTVDLLQAQTLGLGDQDISVDEASRTERSPDEEDSRLQVSVSPTSSDHVWCDDGDNAVPEPVGCSGKSNTMGADGQGKNLADYDPSAYIRQ